MKFSFVDKMISSSSFIELCNVVKDYGFDGIADGIKEFLLSMIYDELPRGIFENYDSKNRRGKFNPSFSWSSAFIIEFILNF